MQFRESALMEAVKRENTAVVIELVKAGANVNLQNKVCLYMMNLNDWCIVLYS